MPLPTTPFSGDGQVIRGAGERQEEPALSPYPTPAQLFKSQTTAATLHDSQGTEP